MSEIRTGRHTGADRAEPFASGFGALGTLAYAGVQVSANVVEVETGATLVSIDDRIVLPTASVGTLLLLIEVSARITAEPAEGLRILDRMPTDRLAASGIWQHLAVPSLPVSDLAALIGASSDAVATTVLLRHVGLDVVRDRAEMLGLAGTALLDFPREHRGPDDAPHLSVGSTAELSRLLLGLSRGDVIDEETSERVLGWLSLNSDLSLVASAFGFDPLAHRGSDHGLELRNTTGIDAGVRCEVGLLRGPRATTAYALTLQFADTSLSTRLAVQNAMRVFGVDLLEFVA